MMVIALSKQVTGLLKMCPAQSLLKGHVSDLQAMCTEECFYSLFCFQGLQLWWGQILGELVMTGIDLG